MHFAKRLLVGRPCPSDQSIPAGVAPATAEWSGCCCRVGRVFRSPAAQHTSLQRRTGSEAAGAGDGRSSRPAGEESAVVSNWVERVHESSWEENPGREH